MHNHVNFFLIWTSFSEDFLTNFLFLALAAILLGVAVCAILVEGIMGNIQVKLFSLGAVVKKEIKVYGRLTRDVSLPSAFHPGEPK